MFISETGCSHALFRQHFTVFNSNHSVRSTVFILEGQLQPSIVARVTPFLWATSASSSECVIPSEWYSLQQLHFQTSLVFEGATFLQLVLFYDTCQDTFSAQLLLQKCFLRISNSSEHKIIQEHGKVQKKMHKNTSRGNVRKATTKSKCSSLQSFIYATFQASRFQTFRASVSRFKAFTRPQSKFPVMQVFRCKTLCPESVARVFLVCQRLVRK